MSDRILVAARVLQRDHGHVLIDNGLSVRLEGRVIERILQEAGRSRYDGFQPTKYDSSPLALHDLPEWKARRIRDTRNKRLTALIGLAEATRSTISFKLPETRMGKGLITVDLDMAMLVAMLGASGKPDESGRKAMAFAEDYLRIELASATRTLENRAGSALNHLPFSYAHRFSATPTPDEALPTDPAGRIAAYLGAFARLRSWLKQILATDGAKPAMDVVDRLTMRARIRRSANAARPDMKGRPDKLADLLEEAAEEIVRLRN
jgi:hypothetical protein